MLDLFRPNEGGRMRKSLVSKACTGLVALGMMTGVHAVQPPQFEVQMDWSNFGVTLTDLDLNDGSAPSLQWTSQTTGASILINGTMFSTPSANDFTSIVSVDDGLRFAGADAGVVSTTGSGLDQTLFFLEIYASRYGNFTLSPMTSVEFTLPVSASALGIPLGISFIASMGLSANFTSSDSAGISEGQTISTRTLIASFSNQDPVAPADVSFDSHIVINAFAAPVPEPGEWALMLVGLGLVAAAVARRHSRRI